jgi:hypothetical protein
MFFAGSFVGRAPPGLHQPQQEALPSTEVATAHPPAPAAFDEPPDVFEWEDPYDADQEASIAIHGMAGFD